MPRVFPPDLADARILLVDDQATNLRLLERLLRREGYRNIELSADSSRTVALCERLDPDLLLLDLHMPAPDGFAVLERLAAHRPPRGAVPILVLTGDHTRETRQKALALGARDFLSKPFEPVEVSLRIRNLLDTRRLHLELEARRLSLEDQVDEQTRELAHARIEVLERLALAAEYRDDATGGHTRRVGTLAGMLARRLGLSAAEAELIERAAPLHDIGKVGIPDRILLKPGPLTPEERDVMRTHTTIGARILGASRVLLLQLAETIALTHHERWDGLGYPQRLGGPDIPVAGRLVAVADVFDSLQQPRVYRPACSRREALRILRAEAGSQFDPQIVPLLLDAYAEEASGTSSR
jgi:putative two-component system response regulator